MAIVGVLAGLLLPAVQRVRAAAIRTECGNNLRQIGIALHRYHDANAVLPPGCSGERSATPFMSWCTRILPYLEHDALWQTAHDAFIKEPSFMEVPPHTARSVVVSVLTCRSDPRGQVPRTRRAFTYFLGVEGTDQFTRDGVLFLDSKIRLTDIADGTTRTVLVGERPPSADGGFGWWYAGWGQGNDGSADMVLGVREMNVNAPWGGAGHCPPGPYHFGPGSVTDQCDTFHFWSLHAGGANFAFVDGSVHFLAYSADAILPALATRSGAEAD
jgi:prepilin-type processing-associated H-X9-DG protein